VIKALNRLEFLVVQDLFLCETARLADVVLPGASFLEKEGTFVNSDRRVQRVRRAIQPIGNSRPDGDIIHDLARRMGYDLGFDDGPGTPVDSARVMDEIAALTPKWGGISHDRLDRLGHLQWPCPTVDHPGTAIVHAGGAFLRGKGRFFPTPWEPPAESVDPEYPFLLTTGRILYHYNVGTMTRRTDIRRLNAAREERVRIHPQDANRLNISTGQWVTVSSRRGSVQVRAELNDEVPPGVVFMSFHYPETRTNLLTGLAADTYTRCPEYKVNAVRMDAIP
jgi:predicted molibdopterin-dependent oxidoreductase YjgC